MKSEKSNLYVACAYGEKLSEEARAVYATFPADWNALYVRAIRDALAGKPLLLRRIRSVTAIDYPVPEGVEVREERFPTDAGELRVRFYCPKHVSEKSPAVLYVHGGGWCMGGVENCSLLCGKMAAELGVFVVVPEYRLAPEFPFPAALEDVCAIAKMLRARAADYGIDTGKIFWAGDSAGAQLCLTAALRLLDCRSEDLPCGLALLYPVTRMMPLAEEQGGSRVAYDAHSMLSNALLNVMADTYAAETDRRSRELSPTETGLSGLPPTLILAAECDILCDDAAVLAEKMRADGVSVTHKVLAGLPHAFALLPGFDAARKGLFAFFRDFGICR